jgi:hypothetical protein
MNTACNRISGLIDQDDVSAETRVRTPAKRQASRVNGSRSGGPTSVEGKRRSSRNAIKHGLLAQRFTPPADVRDDDLVFQTVRKSLIAQFDPQSFTEQAMIDALAHDHLLLARARAMVERLYEVPPPIGSNAQKWEQLRSQQAELRQLKLLVGQCERGSRLAVRQPEAEKIADQVVSFVTEMKSQIADLLADEQDEEYGPADYELKEDEQMLKLWAVIKTAFKGLSDRRHLLSALNGKAALSGQDRAGLHAVLKNLAEGSKGRLTDFESFRRDSKARARARELAIAAAPKQILLIEKYVAQIERRIFRKLRELRAA